MDTPYYLPTYLVSMAPEVCWFVPYQNVFLAGLELLDHDSYIPYYPFLRYVLFDPTRAEYVHLQCLDDGIKVHTSSHLPTASSFDPLPLLKVSEVDSCSFIVPRSSLLAAGAVLCI